MFAARRTDTIHSPWNPTNDDFAIQQISAPWTCKRCTLQNADALKRCSACNSARPDLPGAVSRTHLGWDVATFRLLGEGQWRKGDSLEMQDGSEIVVVTVEQTLGDKLCVCPDAKVIARKNAPASDFMDSQWMSRNNKRLAPLSPLMIALHRRSLLDAEEFILRGSPLHVRTMFGRNPMYYASGSPEMIELLARHGARLDSESAISSNSSSSTLSFPARWTSTEIAAFERGRAAFTVYQAKLAREVELVMCDQADLLLPRDIVRRVLVPYLLAATAVTNSNSAAASKASPSKALNDDD